MPTQHKNIVEADLHESKGVSTATSGAIFIADGAGSGSFTVKFVTYSLALSPVAVAANTTAEQALTVAGIGATDLILSIIKPTAQAGLGIVGYGVTGANTIGVTFSNNTASPITPTAAETYKIIIMVA